MDPGYIVVVLLGVLVVASALGVALVTIVLSGIRGEHAQWPVLPDASHAVSQEQPSLDRPAAEPRADQIPRGDEVARGGRAEARDPAGGEPPEWTGRDLAGDDLRPVGTHSEKHGAPGKARWW